ncbi:MAG TPA: DUF6531 domain-containing protein, partial [Rhodocyclaceae bacterium]|nr:DUF6531 domain-containing protein [Rhodocyclaceae bacterium]
MVAVVDGTGLGLTNSSLGSLAGQAALGQAGDQAYINAANGNLVIQQQDQMLLGIGPDIDVVRTYNSQGQFNDDNGDNWRLSFARQLYKLTGTVNTAGSTVTRIAADGAEQLYTYNSTSGNYINTDGA